MEQTQAQQNRVVVVSQPGTMREALVTFLASFSVVGSIASADGALTALELIRRQPPGLLVIDSNLPEEESAALLRRVKREWPRVGCLILGLTSQQRQQWLEIGADEMLTRYCSAQEMESALLRLIQPAAL